MIDKILGALLGFGVASAVSSKKYDKGGSVELHKHPQGHWMLINPLSFQVGDDFVNEQDAKDYAWDNGIEVTNSTYAKGGEVGTYFVNFYDGTDESGGNNLGRAKVEAKDLDSALMLAESDFEERESEKASEYREGGNYLQVKTPKGTLLYSDNDGWTDTQLTPVNENEFARGGSTYAEGGKVYDETDYNANEQITSTKKTNISNLDTRLKRFYQNKERYKVNIIRAKGMGIDKVEVYQKNFDKWRLFKTYIPTSKGGSTYAEGGEITEDEIWVLKANVKLLSTKGNTKGDKEIIKDVKPILLKFKKGNKDLSNMPKDDVIKLLKTNIRLLSDENTKGDKEILTDSADYISAISSKRGSTYADGGTTKNWVQKVEDSPDFDKGGFSREAKKRGLSTQALFNKVMKSPKRYSEKLRKQAIFMENAYKFKVTKK